MTRTALRWLVALIYAAAGIAHLLTPAMFVTITPAWVPAPDLVVEATGVAEIVGALALLQGRWPGLRRAAGWAFAAYALCVWPANFNHMMLDMARPDGGWGLGYHVPRLLAQPVLIWLGLWVSGAAEWPFGPSTSSG